MDFYTDYNSLILNVDRLRNPLKKKNNWHYFGEELFNIETFIKDNY